MSLARKYGVRISWWLSPSFPAGAAVSENRPGVSVGFGIGVLSFQVFVRVGLAAFYEAGSFLVEVAVVENTADVPLGTRKIVPECQLLLIIA